jgi:hypothetical protein
MSDSNAVADEEVLTTARGETYVMDGSRRVYVFNDPINYCYYPYAYGIVLDKQWYHKETLVRYLENVPRKIVPHTRRILTTEELRALSPRLLVTREVPFVPGGNAVYHMPYGSNRTYYTPHGTSNLAMYRLSAGAPDPPFANVAMFHYRP